MKYKAPAHIAKTIFVLIISIGASTTAVSQPEVNESSFFKDRFISSAGLFFAEPLNENKLNNYAGLSFSPQLNLLNSFSDFSIALGSQLDAGYKISADNTGSKFMTSIPAVITLNFGHGASRDFYSLFGAFVGGGYDFCFLNSGNAQGVMWTAGLRTWFIGKSFTLRYSQLIFNEGATMRTFSLQLNLGEYLKQVYKNNQISRFVKPMRR